MSRPPSQDPRPHKPYPPAKPNIKPGDVKNIIPAANKKYLAMSTLGESSHSNTTETKMPATSSTSGQSSSSQQFGSSSSAKSSSDKPKKQNKMA
ncbi:hypothetical protein BWQ96_09345 [Gracilariopsis chorda]|uniref:Uncharacterized protein n=1 Tax=Gracilariopsis chorda TaxID=448386 RepID=A0A2V3IIK1_9FLOR|nr:hypothetical protein BWQ96_09345 [Gracilariopsis chorda]|eukprot:PXF40950.1 hypothetical protein BWQ96_09345 [Gracilariopsis chorda]